MERLRPIQSDVESLFHHLSRAHHQMLGILQREIDKIEGHGGLQPGMRHLFCALAHEEGLTVSELAARLRMAKSSVTGMVKRMEAADLAVQKPDPHDLRVRRVMLTERGHALRPACARIDATISERLDAEFSPEERAKILELLSRLISTLSATGVD